MTGVTCFPHSVWRTWTLTDVAAEGGGRFRRGAPGARAGNPERRSGSTAEAHLRVAAASGSPEAEFELAKHLVSVGRAREAEQLVRSVIRESGCAEVQHEAPALLIDLMTTDGRAEEAERFRRFGLCPDGSTSPPW